MRACMCLIWVSVCIFTFAFRIAVFEEETREVISIFKRQNKHQIINSQRRKDQIFDELCQLIEPYYVWYLIKSKSWFPTVLFDNETTMNVAIKAMTIMKQVRT